MRILFSLLLLAQLPAAAQQADDFNDGDLTSGTAWTATPAAWTVNSNGQLQSAATTPNSSFAIAAPNALASGAQWDLWLRLAFNPSSQNYVDVWLLSATAQPDDPANRGYFVRIGGAADELALYRKDAGAPVKIIDGVDGQLDRPDNELHLRVLRTAAGGFRLQRSNGGAFVTEGTATDSTYTGSAWFAIAVRQSTASFFGKHYFDDLRIAPYVPDLDPPELARVVAIADTLVDVYFSEPVDPAGARNPANYSVNEGVGAPLSATGDASDGALLHLRFAGALPQGRTLLLTARRIRDEAGNELVQDTDSFVWYVPRRNDVVISEVMADPSPPQALPAVEYVELRNRSPFPVPLRGWQLASGSNRSGPLPDLVLAPDSFLIVCAPAAAASLLRFGRVAAPASFPALGNDGDTLGLVNAAGAVVHSLVYTKSDYGSAVKQEGGWSLELVDATQPCRTRGNWKASRNPEGGTPARRNSVEEALPGSVFPQLLRSYVADSATLVLLFSDGLDSAAAVQAQYGLSNGVQVLTVGCRPPLFREVWCRLAVPLPQGAQGTVQATGLATCTGAVPAGATTRFGRPVLPDTGFLVFNELLFAPTPAGAEFVELLHRGALPVDAGQLYLATRAPSGSLGAPMRLSDDPFTLYPGDHLVISEDAAGVQRGHFVAQEGLLLELKGMPALPDGGGTLVLLNSAGTILDEVRYAPDWHFALVQDPHGVSLERIRPGGPTQDAGNWHSAARTAGYGTPTARNSQYAPEGNEEAGAVTVRPAVFSPDHDGHDDLAFIDYRLERGGYVANCSIFDASGRPVRALLRNGLLGPQGTWSWDGLDDAGRKLPVGVYIIFTELFALDGTKQRFKKTVVLARRL
ncbi:lamin tail domain-containing protein [Flaviaesturariibacter amylovorans]|uniref:Lamin tail domain-containing protein n=1 Tax=Flaviaesturariibacter amylovorans TaxID=1084520 RepID=A0ABP8HQQ6_9BACT